MIVSVNQSPLQTAVRLFFIDRIFLNLSQVVFQVLKIMPPEQLNFF